MHRLFDKPRLSSLFYVIASAVVLFLGVAIRLSPLYFFDLTMPHHLGALYVAFAHQISEHNYSLPVTIPYFTDGGIPFAYPPLSFYFLAMVTGKALVPDFVAVNILPPVFSICAFFAFGLALRQWTKDRSVYLASLLTFAVVPSAYSETLFAIGFVESIGMIVTILFLVTLDHIYLRQSFLRATIFALSWALCIVTSPGSAFVSVVLASILFFCFLYQKNWRAVLFTFFSATLTLIVTTPYWLNVVINHGIKVFTATIIDQYTGSATTPLSMLISLLILVSRPFTSIFAGGSNIDFLFQIALLLGIAYCLLWRLLPLLVAFFVLVSVPREGVWLVAPALAVIVGLGLAKVISPNVVILLKKLDVLYSRRFSSICLILILCGTFY